MKAARIKIERNQEQYQNIVNLSKKKNKPQEVVVNDTVKQTSPTTETMPQTVEQARKHYAISRSNLFC
ncbi:MULTISPECIES: hypothetical protein [unclassified Candidatus Tisiphia]|jgi:hypothetical protein|uniref:hypothetical protein n=1 Tax=unclassified Candidatus Tisiphia TaxID=2996318 RepID=UPI001D9BF9C8|nr:hypothetical protein [Rickettsia endosymbiont of Sericostoma sp. HW-2014]